MVKPVDSNDQAVVEALTRSRGRAVKPRAALVPDAPIDEVAVIGQQNQVAILTNEHDNQVRELAQQLGYLLPADSTNPDLIMRDIAANMRRSVEACLEVGRGLRVLKEVCGHGNFHQHLDQLGIETGVAARFISAATKFSSLPSTSALTKAIGTQSKLIEMLVLDDEQLEELELTGYTGELSLDDVSTMSVKELRKALREAREEGKAKDRVMADKSSRISDLETQLARKPLVVTVPMDKQLTECRDELAAKANAAEAAIAGALHPAVHLLMSKGEESGLDQRPVISGMLAQVEQAIAEIRTEYGIAAGPSLAWMAESSESQVASALANAQAQG